MRTGPGTLVSLCFTSIQFFFLFLFPLDKHVFAAHAGHVVYLFHPLRFTLRAMAFTVTFSLTLLGVRVESCSAIVVISLLGRQDRHLEVLRSCFRCHGLVYRAELILKVSLSCHGLFYVNRLHEIYQRPKLGGLFQDVRCTYVLRSASFPWYCITLSCAFVLINYMHAAHQVENEAMCEEN